MNFEQHKRLLNRELEQFNSILNEVLPRYVKLIEEENPTAEQLKEIGEVEYFLIELNGKIGEIKNRLDQSLFGETMDLYYKMKSKAEGGNPQAKIRFDQLREALRVSLNGDRFFNWN